MENQASVLIEHLEQLHTTQLGVERIKRNLSLETEDVVSWCKEQIKLSNSIIVRQGKNWYVHSGDCVITVNAHSYTIITAHKEKKQ